MGRERLRRRAGVLAVRDFRRFYTGYATSLLGSSMSTVAIAWAVLDSGANATGLGYVFAAAVVPQVLLMAIAGAIADRLGRRRVMLTADALRCAAQASLAAAVFAGRPALWVFVLLAGLVGTGEAFFTPAMDALTVEVAPRDQLGNANALYGLATSATRIAGPLLGGLLIALTGPGVVVAADAASYAVSVLALSLLTMSGGTAGPAPAGRPASGRPASGRPARLALWRDMAEGWADFRSRTWLWTPPPRSAVARARPSSAPSTARPCSSRCRRGYSPGSARSASSPLTASA
jgi:MFS family permease